MKNIYDLLKNPIWQGLSALIAVIGIFLSLSSPKPNELAIINYDTFKNLSEYFPDSKIKFTIEGETSNLDNLYYRYFYVYNPSSLPIKPDDFKNKINVRSNNPNVELLLVSSCVNKKPPDKMVNVSNPQFNWSRASQGWELEPELINSEESGCMIMIIRNFSHDQADIKESDFMWNGRIVGSNLKTYSSVEEYWKLNMKMADYLQMQVEVTFGTIGVIWFLILQYFLFTVPLYVAKKLKVTFLSNINNEYVFVFFSITTSEILVSMFINRVEQHSIVWPLLLAHFVLFMYLARRAYITSKPVS